MESFTSHLLTLSFLEDLSSLLGLESSNALDTAFANALLTPFLDDLEFLLSSSESLDDSYMLSEAINKI